MSTWTSAVVNRPKDQGDELFEVNFSKEEKEAQPVFISASLSADLNWALLGLLRELKDVFVWTHIEIPGLDPQLVVH